ncbi:MAG: DUF5666 domain-containing protein [Capsulimonadaceae bacterium]
MKNGIKITIVATGLVMALAAVARAQNGPPPGGPGGPNGPVAMGQVTSIDATGTSIELTNRQGNTRNVVLTSSTTISGETSMTLSQIAVGDTINAHGTVGTGTISADHILDGNLNAAMPAPPPPPGGSSAPAPPPPAPNTVQGTVGSLSPLTITTSGGTSVTVTTTSSTVIEKIVTDTFSDITVGDNILAGGTPASDGSLTANKVAVNLPPPPPPPGQ